MKQGSHTDQLEEIKEISDIMLMSKKRSRSRKFSRWGRKEDCKLFSDFYQQCIRNNVDMTKLLNFGEITSGTYEIMKDLMLKHNWKGESNAFFKRIKKVFQTTSSLSVRQTKLLLKLVKQSTHKGKGSINFESFISHFPGTTPEVLRNHYDEIMNR